MPNPEPKPLWPENVEDLQKLIQSVHDANLSLIQDKQHTAAQIRALQLELDVEKNRFKEASNTTREIKVRNTELRVKADTQKEFIETMLNKLTGDKNG